MLEMGGNPISGTELATVAPISDQEGWFIVFEWDDIGYVEDDEADELDATAILESIQEGNTSANEERERRGWSTIEIVGWQETPFYDIGTNNLTWAILGSSGTVRGDDLLLDAFVQCQAESAQVVGMRGQTFGDDQAADPRQRAAAAVQRIGVDERVTDGDHAQRDRLASFDQEAARVVQIAHAVHG